MAPRRKAYVGNPLFRDARSAHASTRSVKKGSRAFTGSRIQALRSSLTSVSPCLQGSSSPSLSVVRRALPLRPRRRVPGANDPSFDLRFRSGQSGTGRTTFVNTLCESEVLTHKELSSPDRAHEEDGIKIKPINVGASRSHGMAWT